MKTIFYIIMLLALMLASAGVLFGRYYFREDRDLGEIANKGGYALMAVVLICVAIVQ